MKTVGESSGLEVQEIPEPGPKRESFRMASFIVAVLLVLLLVRWAADFVVDGRPFDPIQTIAIVLVVIVSWLVWHLIDGLWQHVIMFGVFVGLTAYMIQAWTHRAEWVGLLYGVFVVGVAILVMTIIPTAQQQKDWIYIKARFRRSWVVYQRSLVEYRAEEAVRSREQAAKAQAEAATKAANRAANAMATRSSGHTENDDPDTGGFPRGRMVIDPSYIPNHPLNPNNRRGR